MKNIKYFLVSLVAVAGLLGIISPSVHAVSPYSNIGAACTNKPILTFPSWYKGLQCETVKIAGQPDRQQPQITKLNDIWVIALNLVEALIGAVAYIAAGFIAWAGFKYIKSRGDPGKIAEAKTAIIQAITGLGIALASTAIVRYIQSLIA